MLIIPVIDLIEGHVVHAKSGDRSAFAPLNSPLCNSSDPVSVTNAYLSLYPFQHLYVADLDAIEGRGSNYKSLGALQQHFPFLEIWVDAGIRDQSMLRQLEQHDNIRPVIGSETLTDTGLLETACSPILSLDYRNGRFLGIGKLETDIRLWPHDIIVMSLSHVGSKRGPDWELLRQLNSHSPSSRFFSAGGVRNLEDLQRLADSQCSGALVATALHNRSLDTSSLQKIMQAPGNPGT